MLFAGLESSAEWPAIKLLRCCSFFSPLSCKEFDSVSVADHTFSEDFGIRMARSNSRLTEISDSKSGPDPCLCEFQKGFATRIFT